MLGKKENEGKIFEYSFRFSKALLTSTSKSYRLISAAIHIHESVQLTVIALPESVGRRSDTLHYFLPCQRTVPRTIVSV